jgi:hypothetical protein
VRVCAMLSSSVCVCVCVCVRACDAELKCVSEMMNSDLCMICCCTNRRTNQMFDHMGNIWIYWEKNICMQGLCILVLCLYMFYCCMYVTCNTGVAFVCILHLCCFCVYVHAYDVYICACMHV